VKPGDTIHLEIEVTSKRVTRDGGRGIVEFDVKMINQRSELAVAAIWKIMFKTRNSVD
jgi:acyl dehydratase